MIESAFEILAWVLLGTGAVFSVIGGIGMLRLPDFYTRMHAAGVTDTMGAWFILGGLICLAGLTLVSAKLVLILFFLFLTGPTATHALIKTAWYAGVKPRLSGPIGTGKIGTGPTEKSEGSSPSKP